MIAIFDARRFAGLEKLRQLNSVPVLIRYLSGSEIAIMTLTYARWPLQRSLAVSLCSTLLLARGVVGPTLALGQSQPEYHKIITLDQEVFAAEQVELISDQVGFQDHFSGRYFLLDTAEVVLIVYKNGQEKVLGNPDVARRYRAAAANPATFAQPEPSTTIEFSPAEQDYFARRALTKTRAFGEYLRIISDASVDELDQHSAVQEALKLFYDEERLVEVTSLRREEPTFYKINEYLSHIRALSYARVELLWNQVAYVNQIKKGEDGEYHGIITVEQIFKGYNRDDVLVYEDVTQKNIDIIVKPVQQIIDGQSVEKWDVFLSDIGVKNTSEL